MKKLLVPFVAIVFVIACTDPANKKNDAKPTSGETPKKADGPTASANNAAVTNWMSWEGGVDIAGVTDKNLKMPNVIIHLARMVNTPVGSAASGLVHFQPDSTKPPVVMGFVSTNKTVGAYFGPKIFAGTPFEKAPVLDATIDITATSLKVVAGGHTIEATFGELGAPYLIDRAMGSPMPFYQQGVEQKIGKAIVKVDGKEITLILPPVGISGGPGAVVSPNGIYAR
jgi:hypothetical protein